jgi:hypothetical protein
MEGLEIVYLSHFPPMDATAHLVLLLAQFMQAFPYGAYGCTRSASRAWYRDWSIVFISSLPPFLNSESAQPHADFGSAGTLEPSPPYSTLHLIVHGARMISNHV